MHFIFRRALNLSVMTGKLFPSIKKLKTSVNRFLSRKNTVGRLCTSFFAKERPCAGLRERRKKIDPRYTNSQYTEFVDRRKHSEIYPLPDPALSSVCREHPVYNHIMVLGIIAAFLLLLVAMFCLSPSTEDIREITPKTIMFK